MIEGLQQANISLDKGIVRTPSLGQEGELSECVNLIPHAGEIVRIKEPQPITEDVRGLYLYYTLVLKPNIYSNVGTVLTVVLSEKAPANLTVKVTGGGKTEELTLYKNDPNRSFELPHISSVDDISSVEVGSPDFMLALPSIGRKGLHPHKLFGYERVEDVTFPTEEEQANKLLELQPGGLLLETNRCVGKENLIVRSGNSLVYYRPGEGRHTIATLTEEEVEVVTIGQTLVVSQGVTKRYFVWGEDGYKEQNIAEARPRVEMSLGSIRPHATNADRFVNAPTGRDVKIHVGESGYFTQEFPSDSAASRVLYNFGEDSDGAIHWARFFGVSNNPNDGEEYEMDSEVLTNLIRGAYNQVREKMRERGLACFPFYVRWGVRLYDGSVVNLSAPILMTPSSIIRPKIGLYRPKNVTGVALVGSNVDPSGATWSFTPLFAARYLYATIDATTLKNIDDKLIEGVVVYAAPEIEVTDKEYDFNSLVFYPVDNAEGKITDALGNTLNRVVNSNANSAVKPNPEYIDMVATLDALKSDDALANAYASMTDPTTFYEVMVIPMDVLKENGYKVVATIGNGCFPAFKTDNPNVLDWANESETDFTDPDEQYNEIVSQGYAPHHVSREKWSTLTAQSKLEGGDSTYGYLDIVGANTVYSYNSRLLYGGISQRTNPSLSVPEILGENRNPSSREGGEMSVYADAAGKYLTLANTEQYLQGFKGEIPVVFGPSAITDMAMEDKGAWSTHFTLGKSTSLGGYKVWTQLEPSHLRALEDISKLYLPAKSIGEDWYKNDASTTFDIKPNSVAVTKVANPWVIEAIYELACGEIYALTSATEALSEGQFGEFPIYAFTDNGIYALSIDRDGTIEAKQPISRDVLLGMNSTLQIDKAVIYPTKEGLKLISGRTTSLLSASIAGLNVQESGFSAPLELTIADTAPFQEQLEGIKMVYDYAHQMIHVFGEEASEGKQKHYVYDLGSGQWATQILDKQLTTCVAGYPFSTMQFGTQLMQYTNELEADVVKQGWLLTRPISFNDPFTRKMLADIRLLGQKTNTDTKFKVQVYISEDRVKWHRLTSLKGRSAKWYRFLIKADMCGLDTLTGITCQYVPRLGNKLR